MNYNWIGIRKIETSGRIMLPKIVCREQGIDDGSYVKLIVDDNRIIIEPYDKGCLFCGTTEATIDYNGRIVCKKCLSNALNK